MCRTGDASALSKPIQLLSSEIWPGGETREHTQEFEGSCETEMWLKNHILLLWVLLPVFVCGIGDSI